MWYLRDMGGVGNFSGLGFGACLFCLGWWVLCLGLWGVRWGGEVGRCLRLFACFLVS